MLTLNVAYKLTPLRLNWVICKLSTEYFGILGWNTKYTMAAMMPMMMMMRKRRRVVQQKHLQQQLRRFGGFEWITGIVRRNGRYCSTAGSPLSDFEVPGGTRGAVGGGGGASASWWTGWIF